MGVCYGQLVFWVVGFLAIFGRAIVLAVDAHHVVLALTWWWCWGLCRSGGQAQYRQLDRCQLVCMLALRRPQHCLGSPAVALGLHMILLQVLSIPMEVVGGQPGSP